MPSRRTITSRQEPETENEDCRGLVKQVALDSHAQAEKDFLERLRSDVVALYTGGVDRHFNAHIAEFVGVVNADALVFVERHRSHDLVTRTLDNLPTFDRLPVTITSTTHRPFLEFAKSLEPIQQIRFCRQEADPQRILLPIKRDRSWGIMATIHFRQADAYKQIALLVVGKCSPLDVLAFLARQRIGVHQIINSE